MAVTKYERALRETRRPYCWICADLHTKELRRKRNRRYRDKKRKERANV